MNAVCPICLTSIENGQVYVHLWGRAAHTDNAIICGGCRLKLESDLFPIIIVDEYAEQGTLFDLVRTCPPMWITKENVSAEFLESGYALALSENKEDIGLTLLSPFSES